MKPQDLINIHLKAASLLQDIKILQEIANEQGTTDYIDDFIAGNMEKYQSLMKQIITMPNRIREEKPDVFKMMGIQDEKPVDVFNQIADKIFGSVTTFK